MAKLTLIRGLPGSGKSTLAKEIVKTNPVAVNFEADMYFIFPDGQYYFVGELIEDAHQWCFEQTKKYLNIDVDVIVSNTFTQFWELSHYVEFAKQNNHQFEIITCTEQYENIHNAPEKVLERMKERFETHEEILKQCGDNSIG